MLDGTVKSLSSTKKFDYKHINLDTVRNNSGLKDYYNTERTTAYNLDGSKSHGKNTSMTSTKKMIKRDDLQITIDEDRDEDLETPTNIIKYRSNQSTNLKIETHQAQVLDDDSTDGKFEALFKSSAFS